ncbi:MAG: SRPBCC family protein [Pseudomonadota bacterium]
MLGLIVTIILVLALAAIVLGYLWPDKVHVERDVIIDAPTEKVFGLISDFHAWEQWSPWAKMDPNAKYEITGSGVGHRMAWTSEERNVGSGAQEIIELKEPSRMVTALDFGEMGKAKATFKIEPAGQASKVTWALDTHMREGVPPLRQPMATFFGFFMEKWIGKSYEDGLADLKKVAEAA